MFSLFFPGDSHHNTGRPESLFPPFSGTTYLYSRCLIRRGNADTPEGPRDTSPNSETSTSTTHSVCGKQGQTDIKTRVSEHHAPYPEPFMHGFLPEGPFPCPEDFRLLDHTRFMAWKDAQTLAHAMTLTIP